MSLKDLDHWISDSDEMKSTSEYVFILGEGEVSCK